MRLGTALRIMPFWPPYLGAGISVTKFSKDFTSIDVKMKLRFWNKNYVGTHFGGSLYSMADPFFMLMLLDNLGRDYIVWDKAATIRFIKPGGERCTRRLILVRNVLLRLERKRIRPIN